MRGDSVDGGFQVCVGRQPIFDRHRHIFAYELLFRSPRQSSAQFVDPDAATAQVLINSLVEIGLDRVAGSERLFVNCTRYFLENEPILNPRQWVLEVLENIIVDDNLLRGIARCRKAGFQIALDDFEYHPELARLVELADYVKVDVLAQPMEAVEKQVKELQRFPVMLLAEKVESDEQLRHCERLGFQLFQGYFLRKPEIVAGKRPPLNRLNTLCVLLQCQNPDVGIDKVAEVVAADVTLSYRLLQLANSALFGRRHEVQSIERAVNLMGTDTIFRWASLLAMTGFDDCPPAYLELALQRARMCEILATRRQASDTVPYYTAGLLSLLDAMLNQPMLEIIEPLPLAPDIRAALNEAHAGDVGAVLQTVLNWEARQDAAAPSMADLQEAYWEAARYARQMISQLQSMAVAPGSTQASK
jgi:EAL and modified HD-GYP domain-containing signal transduction protein